MTILSNGHLWKYSEFIENSNYSFDQNKILSSLSEKDIDEAYSSISNWESYVPTPLIELNKLSKELNLNKIFYKDESERFDLKSFKALGGAYAVEKITKGNKDIVDSYIKLKNSEINEFNKKENFDKTKTITRWERNNTLDC